MTSSFQRLFLYISVFLFVGCTSNAISTDIPHVLGGYYGGTRPWFTDLRCYTLPAEDDSIRFVRFDTCSIKKPIFIFIQGSIPTPIVVDYGDALKNIGYDTPYYLPYGSFLDSLLLADFHIIEISQPYTPVVAPKENIDRHFAYYPNGLENGFDRNYRLSHQANIYVDRINRVVDFLAKQSWVAKDSIYLYGHSQGAYIAPLVASQNKHVAAIGISGLGPLGGTLTDVLENRILALRGDFSEDEALLLNRQEYSNWLYCRDSTDLATIDKIQGDLPSTYLSFAPSQMELLANLKQPVFCAYGTKDMSAITCDWLPLYFITHHKENYQIIVYKGRGHNFEMINNGEENRNTSIVTWQEVTRSFVDFIRDTDRYQVFIDK